MSLIPYEDVLTKEIESWKGFADGLHAEGDRKVFMEMLNNCYKYAKTINAKGRPFPTEPVIMALLFSQHKLIVGLEPKERINIVALESNIEKPSLKWHAFK